MSYSCKISVLCLLQVVLSIVLTANANSFESFLKLPRRQSSSIRHRTRPRSERLLHVGHFGAKGNGFNDDTKAFEDAWKKACSSKVITRILVPENYTCLIRPIDLSGPCKARLTLQISGTIIAPNDPDDWEGLNLRKWLYFHGVSRLTVEGGGTVNGMGQEWWRRSCKHNHTNPCRGAPTVSFLSSVYAVYYKTDELQIGVRANLLSGCLRTSLFGCKRYWAWTQFVQCPCGFIHEASAKENSPCGHAHMDADMTN